MTPTDRELRSLVTRGIARMRHDWGRIEKVDRYVRGKHDDPYMPTTASPEYRRLAKRAVTNFLPLIVSTPAQAMAVNGFRHKGADSDAVAPEWVVWQRNRMDSRQHAVHRAALQFGSAYVAVLPGEDGQPEIRGASPRQMYAEYDDPVNDALPLWALQVERLPEPTTRDVTRAWLYTPTHVYEYSVTLEGAGSATEVARMEHGVTLDGKPVCPVVRFAQDVDLEGRVTGVVWPLIPIQDKVNQTVFDLLIAQTFGSFKVRTITGMAPEIETDADGNPIYDENGRPKARPIRADASRFMVAPDPDTKFGTLDETPLDGFLSAIEAGVRQMSVISQTPPHYLLGSIVNLSAEALAAAEAALTRAVREYQDAYGESWELVLALAGALLGQPYDREAQISWMDHESRSLAQTVDALGKAVQMLQVPPRELWSKIPGVTEGDVERWKATADEQDTMTRMAERMAEALRRPSMKEPTDEDRSTAP